MGMASSQARLLSITARMNDVEFKSQSIANTKIRLADESEAVSKAYTEALGKTKLMYTHWNDQSNSMQQDAITLAAFKTNGFLTQAGYVLYKGTTPLDTPAALAPYLGTDGPTEYDLYEMIESGEFHIERNGDEVSVSGDNQLALGSVDNVKLAQAEAEYNAATARINRKEKLLDNELKALDTEHNALKTEQDAIKQLVGDNVEKTFNIFS